METEEIYIDTISGEELKIEKEFYDSGKVFSERYSLNDKWHREDGPAYIWYNESGKISSEWYYLNDKCHHRENGPAVIWYYESGEIEKKEYFLNGIECDILQEMVIRGLEEKI